MNQQVKQKDPPDHGQIYIYFFPSPLQNNFTNSAATLFRMFTQGFQDKGQSHSLSAEPDFHTESPKYSLWRPWVGKESI